MVCDNTRRVVIIKNISSNIVEEAILVLKNKNAGKNTVISAASFDKDNSYLLKEAEDIINGYVHTQKTKGSIANHLKRPNMKKSRINTIINIILVACIILLLYLVSKVF